MKNTPMQQMTLRDLLRGSVTTRWHTVPTVFDQNLAEHSHQVGIIAEAMLVRFYAITHGNKPSVEERYLCLKYAQLHDLPEVLLGDLPSPIKARMKQDLPGFTEMLRDMEHQLIPELSELEEAMEAYPHLPILLKAADIVEAQSFFSYAQGRDEEHTAVVAEKLSTLLQSITMKASALKPHGAAIKQAIEQVCAEIFGKNSTVIKSEQVP